MKADLLGKATAEATAIQQDGQDGKDNGRGKGDGGISDAERER
jgi:hypothetical protein